MTQGWLAKEFAQCFLLLVVVMLAACYITKILSQTCWLAFCKICLCNFMSFIGDAIKKIHI